MQMKKAKNDYYIVRAHQKINWLQGYKEWVLIPVYVTTPEAMFYKLSGKKVFKSNEDAWTYISEEGDLLLYSNPELLIEDVVI